MVLPRSKSRATNDSKHDEILKEGCAILSLQAKPNYSDVARHLSEKHSRPIIISTLRRRFLGKTRSRRASHEIQQLLNDEQEKLLNVNARCLNSDEGMIACDRRDEEERRKAEEKGKAAARKLAKEQERERVRAERGPVTAFVGALSSKNKPDLQEIAEALALSKDGTKQELQDRINGYFIAYPRFKEDPKYLGLFLRGNRGQKRPAQAISNDQNTPPEGLNGPQTNRPRHDLEPGPSTSTMSRSLSRDTINIIRSAPVSHLRYPDTSLVPNYTHHLQHNTTYPFHGPPSQYIHPHVVSQAEHGNQHTPPHNLYLNMTPPVHNNYHYSPSQS